MYKLERLPYGLYGTLSGTITFEEIQEYFLETERLWPKEFGPRSSILDVQSLMLPDHEVQAFMIRMFQNLRRQGLRKLAVIVSSPIVKARAIQMAHESSGTDIIRFFDASKEPDWRERCFEWLEASAPTPTS